MCNATEIMNNSTSAIPALKNGRSFTPPMMIPPNSKIVIGAIRVSRSASQRSFANATLKLSRYSPSGITHSSGIATISVVI